MPDQSANLSLPLMLPAQAQKHVTHNEALAVLDTLVQLVVLTRTLTLPPATPAEGERHIVPAGPTGWGGPAGSIAAFLQGAWTYHSPRPGWQAHVLAEARDVIWQGSAWGDPALSAATLGINTAADTTNRLAVASPATLFTHEGAGHQVKVNKAAAGQTASLLFQTGFSGRAEIGLAGNDDLTAKVSADGAVWAEALVAEAATGRVRLPSGLEVTGTATTGPISATGTVTVTGTITGTAVQATADDATANRLLKAGAGGLLGTALAYGAAASFDAVAAGSFFANPLGSDVPANPPAAGQAHAGVMARASATRALQLAANLTGSPARLWWRRQDSAWDAWRHVFDNASVLGTVSQTGGLPTGALIERASNANGDYVRWADGTQICVSPTFTADVTTTAGSGFRSATQTWTFPAAFSSTTGLNLSAAPQGNATTHWAGSRPLGTTSAEVVMHGWTSATGRTTRVMALGRWF
jgi:hypothetical protein